MVWADPTVPGGKGGGDFRELSYDFHRQIEYLWVTLWIKKTGLRFGSPFLNFLDGLKN